MSGSGSGFVSVSVCVSLSWPGAVTVTAGKEWEWEWEWGKAREEAGELSAWLAIKCRKNHKIIVNVERISHYTQGAGACFCPRQVLRVGGGGGGGEKVAAGSVCGVGQRARVLDTPSTLHFLIKFLHCKCKMNLALLCSARSHMSSPWLEVVTWTEGQLAGLTD